MSKISIDWALEKRSTGKWNVAAGYPKAAPELVTLIVGMLAYFIENATRFDVKIDCPDEKTLRDVLRRFADLESYHVGHNVGRALTVENEGDGFFYVDWCNGCYQTTGRIFPDHVEDLNAFEDDE